MVTIAVPTISIPGTGPFAVAIVQPVAALLSVSSATAIVAVAAMTWAAASPSARPNTSGHNERSSGKRVIGGSEPGEVFGYVTSYPTPVASGRNNT